MGTLLGLSGEGNARASGTGSYHAKAHLKGTGTASAAGTGYLLLAPCRGKARAEGVGQISWRVPPKEPGLEDAWFYGEGKRKAMPGAGTASARGEGTLTV